MLSWPPPLLLLQFTIFKNCDLPLQVDAIANTLVTRR